MSTALGTHIQIEPGIQAYATKEPETVIITLIRRKPGRFTKDEWEKITDQLTKSGMIQNSILSPIGQAIIDSGKPAGTEAAQ